MLEVAGTGRLDVGRGGGHVPHMAQDLGIERRVHLVHDLTATPIYHYVSLIYAVIHHDLKSHRLSLSAEEKLNVNYIYTQLYIPVFSIHISK